MADGSIFAKYTQSELYRKGNWFFFKEKHKGRVRNNNKAVLIKSPEVAFGYSVTT